LTREAANAAKGLPRASSPNERALGPAVIIAALCRASQAGVPVDLIVRGVCCLRRASKG